MAGILRRAVAILGVGVGVVAACSAAGPVDHGPPAPRTDSWATSGYEIGGTELDGTERDSTEREVTYARTPATVIDLADPARPVDADGVLQVSWPGLDEPVYHPVSMAMYGLYVYESYRITADPEHLRRAEANARALLDGATELGGALWFGYPFDHELHGDSSMTLEAPWYSGMAQGQVLSLLARLYDETGEESWRQAADGVLASYEVNSPREAPWFAHAIDGRLWLEEYPDTRGQVPDTQVINGHIYAAWGLYDYYTLVEADDGVRELFDAAVTTIRESFGSYRVPGGISYYCAAAYCRDVGWQPESYHRGVAAQLDHLAAMTGDEELSEQAAVLRQDYVAAGGTG